MRKALFLVTMLTLSLLLACAGADTPTDQAAATPAEETPAVQTGPADTAEAPDSAEDNHPSKEDLPEPRPLDPDLPVWSQVFDPERDAAADFAEAKSLAGETKRQVMMKVGGNWCAWCKLLDGFIHDNQDIYMALQDNFVYLKVNVSEDNKNEEFLSPWPKIEGYPHIFIFDAEGNLLHSQNTLYLEEGKGYSHEAVLTLMKEGKVDPPPETEGGEEEDSEGAPA